MKLDQTCPHCRITEAAGPYCTLCLRATQEGWIHRTRQSDAAQGRKPAFTRHKSPRGANPGKAA